MAENPSEQSPASGPAWDSLEAAEAWTKTEPVNQRALRTATERLLSSASIAPGQHVLDIAAGTGDQTLMILDRTGPTGQVTAIDSSQSMLATARHRFEQRGFVSRVDVQLMEAEHLQLPENAFDAAICRLGLMAFRDSHTALMEVQRVIKPGARFAAMVWSAAEKNPFQSLPFGVLHRRGLLQPFAPGATGPFSLGDPSVLDQLFRAALFVNITVEPAAVSWRFDSMEDVLDYYRLQAAVFGREMAQRVGSAQGRTLWAEFEEALRPFHKGEALEVPGEVLIGAGAKA